MAIHADSRSNPAGGVRKTGCTALAGVDAPRPKFRMANGSLAAPKSACAAVEGAPFSWETRDA